MVLKKYKEITEAFGYKRVKLSMSHFKEPVNILDRDGDARVKHFQQKLQKGKHIRPIHVWKDRFSGEYELYDGAHRLAAHQREGKSHIKALVFNADPLDHKNVDKYARIMAARIK